MYYPYLRGKQFDLLALKELVKAGRLAPTIQPIIEPVKQSKTLTQTIVSLTENTHPFYLIDNPGAGDFLTEAGLVQLQELTQNHRAHILRAGSGAVPEREVLTLAFSAAGLQEIAPEQLTGIVAAPFEMRILRQLQDSEKVILLTDSFTRLPRNSYYREASDEVFTMNHQHYQKRGFFGFGDFTLDSQIYYEQGYPDRDLCLHLVYPGKQGEVRVHHFVSLAEEEDRSATQKEKFHQLIEEVTCWVQSGKLPQTLGITILLKAYEEGRFLGMGVMRKSTIMHHLEVMGSLL